MRIGLVGCSAGKQAGRWPARELYNSQLFRGRRRWVEATCDRWYILSALYLLVDPEEPIDSYNLNMHHLSPASRRQWSARVAGLLRTAVDLEGAKVELHAGQVYLDYGLRHHLREAGAVLVEPAAGLGIGKQLSLYKIGPPT